MEFFRDTKIDFMRYRKHWIIVSLLLLAVGMSEVLFDGLNLGVDFAGGTQMTIRFQGQPEVDRLRDLVESAGFTDPQIQRFGDEADNEVMIKTATVEGSEEGSRDRVVVALDREYNQGSTSSFDLNRRGTVEISALLLEVDPDGRLSTDDTEAARSYYETVAEAVVQARDAEGILSSWDELSAAPGVSSEVLEALRSRATLGKFSVVGLENVGPQIGKELRNKGFLAVVMSLLGMLAYIWIRFELRFGIGALMATVHDVGVCLGLYALAGFEFNLTTIAAFLTLVGYSVNDTVVIFDRVRENMRKNRRMPLVEVMNQSINQTMSRTILTSGTTLLAVGSLLVFGGDVIRGFAFTLTVGVVVGTYSSIYIASPFALLWEQMFGSESRRRSSTKAAKTA